MTEYTVDRLSASRLKKFRNCPLKYFFRYASDIDFPEEDEVEYFEIGNTVHDSIEIALEEPRVIELDKDDIYKILKYIEADLDYNYDGRKQVETCLEFAAKYLSEYVNSVQTVEEEMTEELDGIDFTGYADLIGDVGDKADVVIDWKTGKENDEWKERIQGGVYAKMFREEYGRWPESIQFVYLNEGTRSVHRRIDDGEVMWNDHQNKYWDEIRDLIAKIVDSSYKGEFEAKPGESKCHWCDYKYACEEGGRGASSAEPQHFQVGGIL